MRFILRCLSFKMVMLLFYGISDNPVSAQSSQQLSLSDAINSGLKNYQSIKAKRNYLQALCFFGTNTRNEYLPNVIASVQQNYGTINGQHIRSAPLVYRVLHRGIR